jgi:hypothetical protein
MVQYNFGVEINWETQEFKEPMRLHHWRKLFGPTATEEDILNTLFRDPDCLKDAKKKLVLDGWDIEDVVDFFDKQARKMSTGTTEYSLKTASQIVNAIFDQGGQTMERGSDLYRGWCANARIVVCSEDPYITNKPWAYGQDFANNPVLMLGFRQALIRTAGAGKTELETIWFSEGSLFTITAFNKEFSAAVQRLNEDDGMKTAFGQFTDHTSLIFPTKLMQQNVQTLWGDIFPYGTLDDSAFKAKNFLFDSVVEAPVDAFYSLPESVAKSWCDNDKKEATKNFCKGEWAPSVASAYSVLDPYIVWLTLTYCPHRCEVPEEQPTDIRGQEQRARALYGSCAH